MLHHDFLDAFDDSLSVVRGTIFDLKEEGFDTANAVEIVKAAISMANMQEACLRISGSLGLDIPNGIPVETRIGFNNDARLSLDCDVDGSLDVRES